MKTVELFERFLYNCGNFPEGKPFVKCSTKRKGGCLWNKRLEKVTAQEVGS